ncbi:MAG: hypothetical protein IPQ25_10415 [Chitinophagaceae bacterium]|nr:hypothetical protein [Chitinophagaceae bacterium]
MQFSFQGMPGGMEQQMPSTRTDKFELTFGNNQSLWKAAEQENDEDGPSSGGEVGACPEWWWPDQMMYSIPILIMAAGRWKKERCLTKHLSLMIRSIN